MEQKAFKMQVSLQSLPMRKCACCGEAKFIPSVNLREVSALLSPNGKPGVIFTDAGFICATCGEQADLTPQDDKSAGIVSEELDDNIQ